jgi:hypothetical protein
MAANLTMETRIAASREHVAAQLPDELVILSVKNEQYFGLNAVGAAIWSLIQEPRTIGAVCEGVRREYPDVEAERCAADAIRLIEELIDAGLVELPDPPDPPDQV